MSLMLGGKLVKMVVYLFKCIFKTGSRKTGFVSGNSSKGALEKVVRIMRKGLVSEVDIFDSNDEKGYLEIPNRQVEEFIGERGMLIRYLDSKQATKAYAPEGKWTFSKRHLYVDGKLVPRIGELAELIA